MWSLWLSAVLVSIAAPLAAGIPPPPATELLRTPPHNPPGTSPPELATLTEAKPSNREDKDVKDLESIAKEVKGVEKIAKGFVKSLENVGRGVKELENIAKGVKVEAPDAGKVVESSRDAKLLNIADRVVHRTLDRGASELAWKNWLQSPENRDPAVPPRRITPKSVFIAPHNCPEGKRLSGEGCISVHTVGKEAHEQYILDQLNNMNDPGGPVYDYDEGPWGPAVDPAEGPLQLNLPLGPSFSSAASQNVPAYDKKDEKRTESAVLEAELEKLKQEIQRISEHRPHTDQPQPDTTQLPETTTDPGQKEVVFGHVSEDIYQFTHNLTHQNIREPAALPQQATTTESSTTEPTSTEPAQADTTETTSERPETTTVPHNLKQDEKPTKLHPEIDYSDIGEAIRLISRYAEVTTDDSFNNLQRKQDDSPLGTRTKQQHRKKQQLVQPEYYRYPAPPADFPFRHVQEYWARDAALQGPYQNPRRHHHSYLQPPRRARRPAPQPPPQLYRLLGLQHWLSGDGAAER